MIVCSDCATAFRQAGTIRAATDAIGQCAELLASMTDEQFRTSSAALFGATIGQHVRHNLDHFGAALAALDGETIDYDRRERGTLVETDRSTAQRELSDLALRYARMGAETESRPARVRVMVDSSGREAVLESTLGREVAFAAHHAIHHHAMIGAIARELGIELPKGFGKAPSTLCHENAAR